MKAWEIIGYAYDADCHCCACTEKMAEEEHLNLSDAEACTDAEVNPIFASEEFETSQYCADCGDLIIEVEEEENQL